MKTVHCWWIVAFLITELPILAQDNVILARTGSQTETGTLPITITSHVVAQGRGVSNAQVVVPGQSPVNTDALGFFEIKFPRANKYMLTVTAQSGSFCPKEVPIEVLYPVVIPNIELELGQNQGRTCPKED